MSPCPSATRYGLMCTDTTLSFSLYHTSTITNVKKVSLWHTSRKSLNMAARKTTNKAARGNMSGKITSTINKEPDKRSTTESRADRYARRDLEKTASSTGKDQDKPQPMSRRSSGLGKRKRKQEDEGEDDEAAEQPGEQPVGQDKECTVCLEVVAKISFPAIDHADGDEHSSDVCLGCWDQHIESEIRSKSFEGISCLQCSQKLVEEEVRHLASERTYAEYAFLRY
jgi:hypothetical protein